MAQAVAQFPSTKQAIRGRVNEMDKSTIVSIFPKAIREVKHTIQPGIFELAPGTLDNPSILVVGSSSWWRDIDDDQPLLEIPVSSVNIADSVVRDYCNGLIACDMNMIMPGLFFLPGEFSAEIVKRDYKKQLTLADTKQKNFYTALIKLADTLWNNSNGNPISISSDMRLAATELGLSTREWMADFRASEMIRCVACGSFRNPQFPICHTCHNIIDPALAQSLGIIPTPESAPVKTK